MAGASRVAQFVHELASRVARRLLEKVRPWIEPAQSYEKNQLGLSQLFLNNLRLTWTASLLADAVVLLRARAIENQVYVIAPNQTGTSPQGFPDYGNSMIVDPWGTVVARASDGEAVITAEIDAERLARVRREMPCFRHARLLS